MKKRMLKQGLVLTGLAVFLGGCTTKADGGKETANETINVITREEGSGTRGAFTELTGIIETKGDTEVDQTLTSATIQNGTSGMLTIVSGDPSAIGYVSVGSLNDSVKALKIDGVSPTAEEIAKENYPIARPFNVAHKGDLEPAAEDFWAFIFSADGQKIVQEEGYIEAVDDAEAYQAGSNVEGKISVVGSTSVTPVMEALAEAYQDLQANVTIDITSNGSSAGMSAALDGSADIGMASRELKEEESAELESRALAIDGIAVIVNPKNSLDNLSVEQIREIFTGEKTKWGDYVQK